VPAVPRACARGYRSVCPSGAGVLKHERFHGFRTARCAAAGASPVATDRRPVGAKNGRYKVCPPLAGSRFPAVGRRLPFWQFPRFSPVAPAFGLPPSACSAVSAVKAVRCCRCHSALRTRNSCSRRTLRPQVSPGFRHPVFRSLFPAFGSYAQRRMAIRPCHKPSNSGQNRSKRRRFPSKRDQKGAHFVMPILTFGGVTPSGASARADFAFRKGKKARFGGAKWRPEKLSTISTKLSTIWVKRGTRQRGQAGRLRNSECGATTADGKGRTAIGQARPCFRNGASMCLALFPLPLRERVAEGRVRGWPLIAPSPPPPLPRWGERRTRHAKHVPARKPAISGQAWRPGSAFQANSFAAAASP